MSEQKTYTMPNPDGSEVKLEEAILQPFVYAARNFAWLFLVALAYVVTVLIPYINIGTTIALTTLPSAMARGEHISVGYIFDARFRKYMGEYFVLWGNYVIAGLISIPFFGIPLLIMQYSWSFAPMLILDKEVNPTEAMSLSTKMTYGYKLKMWLSGLIVGVMLFIGLLIIFALLGAIGIKGFLLFIFTIAIFSFMIAVSLSQTAIFYKNLVVNHE